jgi:hypothetical protein
LSHAERRIDVHAVGLTAFVATWLLGLAVFPSPARSQQIGTSRGLDLNELASVKNAGDRRERYREAHARSHYRHATRPYRYFGADPDRYFGIGPGAYECFGYDCNW